MNKLAILSAFIAPLLCLGCLDSGPGSPTAPKNQDQAGDSPATRGAVVPEIIVEPSGLQFIKGAEVPKDTFATTPDSNFLRNEKLGSNFGPMKSLSLGQSPAKIAAGEPYIVLYQDINYMGAQFIIHGSRDYNALAYSEAGNWNDKASSIRFFNGARAHFWVANDYKGGYYTWDADMPDLRTSTYNDVISSVSWDLPGASGDHFIFVCTDIDCNTGGKTTFYPPLDYNRLPRWEGVGEFNNTISQLTYSFSTSYIKDAYLYFGDSWTGDETHCWYNTTWKFQGDLAYYNNAFSSLHWGD